MKRTGFIIAGCFLLFQCQIVKAQNKNNWEKENLKGRVKEVKEVKYETKDTIDLSPKGEIKVNYIKRFDSTGNQNEEYYYFHGKFNWKGVYKHDVKGNEIENIFYNSDSTLSSIWIMKYDDNGKLIKRTQMNSDSFFQEIAIWKYNLNGNEIEHDWFFSPARIDAKWISIYDSFGKLKETKMYKSDSFFSISSYKYDNKGKLIKKKSYNLHGWLTNKDIYKYNSNGSLVKINYKTYKLHGCLTKKDTYKYDTSGNLIEEINYNSFGEVKNKLTYKYDNNKNMTEKCEYRSARNLKSKYTFDYDSYGNLVQKIGYDYESSGEIFLKFNYRYEYDQTGNWIKRTWDYIDSYIITERQITYY